MNSGNAPCSTAAAEVSLDTTRLLPGSQLSGANHLQRAESIPAAARLPSSASDRLAHQSRYNRPPLWTVSIRSPEVPATAPSAALRRAEINSASGIPRTSGRSRQGSQQPAERMCGGVCARCRARLRAPPELRLTERRHGGPPATMTEHVDCKAQSEAISCTD